jgi:hypothetical protein
MTKRVFVLSSLIIATLFFSVLAVTLPVNAQSPDFIPGQTQVVVAFGKIPGQDLYAHVWVVIPHGSDKNQIVNESLRHQGLKPFSHSEFSETGLKHPQFFDGKTATNVLLQYYNSANQPPGVDHSVLQKTQSTWTNPNYGNFAFSDADLTTDRCPSLVKECKGRQVTDKFNDVAWMPIKDRNTLGVTWYSTSNPEADMALNTNFSWSTNGASGTFDVETVYLHENGHVLGLGHSEVKGSIMEPVYAGVRQSLHDDDKCGIQSIYGTQDPDLCGTTTPSPTDPVAGDAETANIDYKIRKGPNGGLLVTVTLLDSNPEPVSGTSVKIELSINGNSLGTATGDTNSEGKASFILSNPVKSGTYSTEVLEVAGVDWDDANQTNDSGFTK